MLRIGIKAIREITDYWMHNLHTHRTDIIRSMNAANFFGEQKHLGFDHSKKYSAGDFCWIEYGNNIEPELSFKHIGLIFMKKRGICFTQSY